ncbi:hypothetical protein [Glycomyces albidus]|uniref:Type II toxin-antitoxin system PemK/MazF family toxin n=1 Tax=Glycomyces albidus TaxID=2656774 RepID=A0A6L5GER2_9ACTN|nr:hypothetical protein [Glycomyces albidus]MQM28192.1 hypothetical protein [Glycomyces albidus]
MEPDSSEAGGFYFLVFIIILIVLLVTFVKTVIRGRPASPNDFWVQEGLRNRWHADQPPPLLPAPPGGPQPRERWYAKFPFEEDPSQTKDRPCLVIGYSGKGYWVLKCTTQGPRHPGRRVPVAAGWWAPPANKDGFVDLVPQHLPRRLLQHRFGRLAGTPLYRQITDRVQWDAALDFID